MTNAGARLLTFAQCCYPPNEKVLKQATKLVQSHVLIASALLLILEHDGDPMHSGRTV